MSVKQIIQKRISVRKYLSDPVPEDLVMKIIEAARLAPSGNNTQPCKYFIISDEETKNKLKENKIFVQDFCYEAPVLIVCTTNPNAFVKKNEELDDTNEMRAIRDLGIASGFMVLQATELGLGTCFVGWLKKEKIKEVLNIPEEYIVPYVITLGYPDEEPKEHIRKNINEILL